MNKSIILFSIISLLAFESIAQNPTVKSANKLYSSKLYVQAIPKYESALRKDSANADVLTNLGDCYRLTNNNRGQLICYGKLVKTGKAEDIHKLYYGQALMEAGKYDDAKKYMEEYKGDKRGEAFAKAITNLQKFSKNADAYALKEFMHNSKFDDFSAFTFMNDKIIFTSNRTKSTWITRRHGWTGNSYCHMFMTEKNEFGEYETPAMFIAEYAPKFNDGPFCASKDGTNIFFTRNSTNKKDQSLDGSQKLKIMQATILNDNLQSLMVLKFNSNEYNCAHPAISADGKTLYFASDMGGGQGGMDLYYCKKDAGGAWGSPINLGEKVNTKGNELFPSITEDNILYFASNGHEGLGGLDIYETKIRDDKAGKVYNMGKPVNSEHDDFAYNLNADGKKGFLSSNRKNGGMNDDIYNVDVLRKVSRGKTVNFIIKDKNTQELLPLTTIKLNTDSFMTNEKGEFQTVLEEDINYALLVKKEKYFEMQDSISTKSSTEEEEFTKTIELEIDPNLTLLAGIYDAKTGAGIEGVKIIIKDLAISNDFELLKTEKNGEYRKPIKGKKIGDKLLYLVTIEKEGYVTKTLNFTYDIKKEGEIQMNELLALTIGKVEVGMDLAKMIDIKPIYFDLGKSKIRPDAAIELNKVVAIMKEYPNMIIELGAHTDCRGGAAANLKLSGARAVAAAGYIVKQGIDKTRISGKGYGESKLLNSCGCEGKVKSTCTEFEHSQNRRTEFIIVKLKN
jgi:outer membrane protein OmpA-like peptidoglycan-associated protein/tetratricopeptide (TPR) repeat protein